MIPKSNITKRFFASLIDYFVVFALTFLYIDRFGTLNNEGGKTVENLMVFPILIFWFLYFVVTESIFGGTPFHLALDLRVLTTERKRIQFGQAFKRHLLDPVDFFLFGIPAYLTIKKSEKYQRAGDMWANTIVVDIKDPEQFKNEQL